MFAVDIDEGEAFIDSGRGWYFIHAKISVVYSFCGIHKEGYLYPFLTRG